MANKKYLDYAGLDVLVEEIDKKYGLRGALYFRGTVPTISNLPTVAGCTVGDMYNVENEGVTTADFVEGAGHEFKAGDNVVAVNIAPEGDPAVMKWDILGGIFVLKDKLTFGSSMPLNPENGDTFLYLGDTTYIYNEVLNPPVDANPAAEGWYETGIDPESGEVIYVPTEDQTVEQGKTYYTKDEQYVKGVIYVWSSSAGPSGSWIAQSSGDIMVPITDAEIRILFQ